MENDRKWWRRLVRLDTVLLLVAVIAGIAGAALSTRYLGASAAATEASLRNRYKTKSVVVAAMDLPAGESLDATRLAIRKVPGEFLPDDAVPADRAADLMGGRTMIPIRRGTPVVAAALRETRSPQRLSAILAGGRRALTIAVDQVNSQAGNLLAGDWVDLYYSRAADGESVLVPLLQHVEVLAIGTSLLGEDGYTQAGSMDRSFSTITLDLASEDAVRVVLAQQSGTVSVVLRAPTDTSQITADPRSSRDFLRRPQKPRASAIDPRIELIVGGDGNLLPERSWLSVGQGRAAAAGDES
jgi:pilus assembly protein CpaB